MQQEIMKQGVRKLKHTIRKSYALRIRDMREFQIFVFKVTLVISLVALFFLLMKV